jgi:hypothetical protein
MFLNYVKQNREGQNLLYLCAFREFTNKKIMERYSNYGYYFMESEISNIRQSLVK